MNYERMAANMRARRAFAGLKQCELADQLGVSQNTVSKWEHGHHAPSVPQLVAMADIYKCSLDALAGREQEGATE